MKRSLPSPPALACALVALALAALTLGPFMRETDQAWLLDGGMGIANAYAGLEMGIAKFDAAVGGLGGCPFAAHKGAAGNVCTEDLVFMAHEMGIETGIDLDALIGCAMLAEEIVGHPLPGSIKQGGNLARLREAVRQGASA